MPITCKFTFRYRCRKELFDWANGKSHRSQWYCCKGVSCSQNNCHKCSVKALKSDYGSINCWKWSEHFIKQIEIYGCIRQFNWIHMNDSMIIVLSLKRKILFKSVLENHIQCQGIFQFSVTNSCLERCAHNLCFVNMLRNFSHLFHFLSEKPKTPMTKLV
jgi:hypothetical protein